MKIRSTNQSNPIRRLLRDHRLILVAVEPHFGHRIVSMHYGAKLNFAERSGSPIPRRRRLKCNRDAIAGFGAASLFGGGFMSGPTHFLLDKESIASRHAFLIFGNDVCFSTL